MTITWRNVQAPNQAPAANMMGNASDTITNAFANLGKVADRQQQTSDDIAANQSQAAETMLKEAVLKNTGSVDEWGNFKFNSEADAMKGLLAKDREDAFQFYMDREKTLKDAASQGLRDEETKLGIQQKKAAIAKGEKDTLKAEADKALLGQADSYINDLMSNEYNPSAIESSLFNWAHDKGADTEQKSKILALVKNRMDTFTSLDQDQQIELAKQQSKIDTEFAPELAPIDTGIVQADKIIARREELNAPMEEARLLGDAGSFINENADIDRAKGVHSKFNAVNRTSPKHVKDRVLKQLETSGATPEEIKYVKDTYLKGYAIPQELSNVVLRSMPKSESLIMNEKFINMNTYEGTLIDRATQLILANVEADAAGVRRKDLANERSKIETRMTDKKNQAEKGIRDLQYSRRNLTRG